MQNKQKQLSNKARKSHFPERSVSSNSVESSLLPQFNKHRLSLLILIITNLIPLIGVLFWAWDVFTIMLLFWLENVIIGMFNVIKMLFCRGPIRIKVMPIIFFILHYGAFVTGHGLILLNLFDIELGTGFLVIWPWTYQWLWQVEPQLWLAVLGIVIMQAFDLLQFISAKASKQRCSQQMKEPYSRIVLTHFVLMIGAFIAIKFGAGVPIVILLVVIKTVSDYQAFKKQGKALKISK